MFTPDLDADEVFAARDPMAEPDPVPSGPAVTHISAAIRGVMSALDAGAPQVVATPYADLNRLFDGGFRAGELVFLGARPGIGKALACDTPLPTPTGWTTMGEVQAGGWLFGSNGRPTVVLGVSDVMHGRTCYEVEFSDGSTIVADEEHLWLTSTRSARRSCLRNPHPTNRTSPFSHDQRHKAHLPAVVTTHAIAETLRVHKSAHANHSVALCGALQLDEARLPIHPYLLGVWLGDGSSANARFYSDDAEVVDAVRATGQRVTELAEPFGYGLPGGLVVALRALGVLNNKHIPGVYLRASERQRRQLLSGLLDTDGGVTNGGTVQFYTTRKPLADGVMELVSSLGYRASLCQKPCKGRRPDSSVCFTVNFSTPDVVFKLTRKDNLHYANRRHNGMRKAKARYIVGARVVPSVPVKCVKVAAADCLYLAGRSFIPTHNTALALEIARYAAKSAPVLVISREMVVMSLARRLVAQDGQIPASELRRNMVAYADMGRMAASFERLSGLDLWLTDEAVSLKDISQLVDTPPAGRPAWGLVIVDYLQLVRSPESVKDRRLQVEAVSQGLKGLALQHKIPVLCLTSLRRPQINGTRPTMADLRESGELEHDADIILLLHREPDEPGQPPNTVVECNVAKNRDGETGQRDLIFSARYVSFSAREYERNTEAQR